MKMSLVTGFDFGDSRSKSPAERERTHFQRLHDLNSAEGSLAIEGLKASPVAARLMERYAADEVSIDDAIESLKQHYHIPTP